MRTGFKVGLSLKACREGLSCCLRRVLPHLCGEGGDREARNRRRQGWAPLPQLQLRSEQSRRSDGVGSLVGFLEEVFPHSCLDLELSVSPCGTVGVQGTNSAQGSAMVSAHAPSLEPCWQRVFPGPSPRLGMGPPWPEKKGQAKSRTQGAPAWESPISRHILSM